MGLQGNSCWDWSDDGELYLQVGLPMARDEEMHLGHTDSDVFPWVYSD